MFNRQAPIDPAKVRMPVVSTEKPAVLRVGLGTLLAPTDVPIQTTEKRNQTLRRSEFGTSYNDEPEPIIAWEDIAYANVITSEIEDSDLHRPVLDIDFPVTVLSSSTPGHSHVFIDKPMSKEVYFRLLDALAEAGIVEPGYVDASRRRGYSGVRLPWVKKPTQDSPKQSNFDPFD